MARRRPALPDFVQRFNEGNASTGGIKLRFGTISEFFDRVRAQPADTLPTLRGDWTDWWNFGAGSTAHETAQTMRGQRDLDAALATEAWHPGEQPRRRAMLHDTARADLALYAEHTWGADRSISHPYSPETRTQQLLKLATAASGASVARMLRRDGLEQLAIDAGGDEPRLLVFNPHPFPVDAIAAPALPAADGRRARSEARLRARRPGAIRAVLAPHPAPGRGDVRPLGRARLLDGADRRSGAVLRHDAGGGRASAPRPDSSRPRTACCPTAASR